VLWSVRDGEAGIDRIVLSRPEEAADRFVDRLGSSVAEARSPLIDALLVRIDAFFNGEAVRFPLAGVRLGNCSAFQRRVLLAEYTVPRGKVTTYGLLAEHLGQPRAARAVGTALARNPFPIVIPCHRAIRSDGTLGGFQGGVEMKRALLEMEGVAFRDAGHVDCRWLSSLEWLGN
jgi:methylated-DNA-[protein]-cysteine S-methyltransferase